LNSDIIQVLLRGNKTQQPFRGLINLHLILQEQQIPKMKSGQKLLNEWLDLRQRRKKRDIPYNPKKSFS